MGGAPGGVCRTSEFRAAMSRSCRPSHRSTSTKPGVCWPLSSRIRNGRTWIPTNPRWGRVMRGCRRGLLAGNGLATVSQLREWCYVGKPYRSWHCGEIRRALKQIGARHKLAELEEWARQESGPSSDWQSVSVVGHFNELVQLRTNWGALGEISKAFASCKRLRELTATTNPSGALRVYRPPRPRHGII